MGTPCHDVEQGWLGCRGEEPSLDGWDACYFTGNVLRASSIHDSSAD